MMLQYDVIIMSIWNNMMQCILYRGDSKQNSVKIIKIDVSLNMIMLFQQGEYHYLFKVVLVGNSNVGKSSLLVRFTDEEFSEVFLTTIGVDFRFKAFTLGPNRVKLQIWDTAGQERFRTITSSYYKGAHALMIVFDLTDSTSFQHAISYWYTEIKQNCDPQTRVLLVGNKLDLLSQHQDHVSQESIKEFLSKNTDVKYIETSAKTAEKVEEAFQLIATMLIDMRLSKKDTNILLKQEDKSTTNKKCCL